MSFPYREGTFSHPYKRKRNVMVLYATILTFFKIVVPCIIIHIK